MRERERERMEIKRKDIHTVGKKKGTFTKDKKRVNIKLS